MSGRDVGGQFDGNDHPSPMDYKPERSMNQATGKVWSKSGLTEKRFKTEKSRAPGPGTYKPHRKVLRKK